MMMILTTYKEKRMKNEEEKKVRERENTVSFIYICMQAYDGAVHTSKEGNKIDQIAVERKDTTIFQ